MTAKNQEALRAALPNNFGNFSGPYQNGVVYGWQLRDSTIPWDTLQSICDKLDKRRVKLLSAIGIQESNAARCPSPKMLEIMKIELTDVAGDFAVLRAFMETRK